MNKNTDPKKLNQSNVGDAVVVVTADGVSRSAILMSLVDGYATFAWRKGPGPSQVALVKMAPEIWPDRVQAIFPPNAKFVALEPARN